MEELRTALPRIRTGRLPGPVAAGIIKRRAEAVPGAVGCQYPVVIKSGAGAMIEDVDGNILLDWVGGVGVLNIGYSHPEIITAVREQAGQFFHGMQNIVTHEGYVSLAEKMNELVPVRARRRQTMFANSGAEAVENAVKIARSSTGRPNIIVFSGAFHGRTLMTMTMTAKKAYARGLGPYPDGIYRAEFPYLYRAPQGCSGEQAIGYYLEKLRRVFEEASPPEYVAAVVVEPVQGEGGFIPAPLEWVKAVRRICDQHGILLIADEVQTGFGRTGRMFASEYWQEDDAAPDLVAFAKSIAGGLPLSGVTAGSDIMAQVRSGVIGGTYGGNAVACAAALKLLEIYKRDRICEKAAEIARICRERFERWRKCYPVIGDVRGIGAMIGIEFVKSRAGKEPAPEIVTSVIEKAVQRGLLLESAGTYGNVIRFLCPLVVTAEQLEAGLQIFEQTLAECC